MRAAHDGDGPSRDAGSLLTAATERLAPLEHRYQLRSWDLHTRESPEHQAAFEAAGVAYETALADPALHAAAEQAEAVAQDEIARRSAEVLRLTTAGKRRPQELIERTVRLETELTGIYGEHRAVVDGRRLSANDVDRVLGSSVDVSERQAVWEASKSVGNDVDEPLRELVRLRNQAARALGYRDHYAMSLELDEIDEGWLFELLDRLDAGLDAAWTAEKAAIDADRRSALALDEDEPVQAWHLVDPFGQEPPSPAEDPLRAVEATIDIEGAARRYFADLGHDVDGVLGRSDLRPREGKDQHAFQITTDRRDDVRMLLNVAPTVYWLDTMLHELGHAVYDLSLDPSLPWLLRTPAHIFTTEAIAMLHGARGRDPVFLERYAGVAPEVARHPTNALVRRRGLHAFVPWVQVMARFERALYGDPDGDLGAVWWQLVERHQRIPRPPGDRARDWATKLHLALAPVYYHNYLLGEIAAAQLEWMLERETGSRSPAARPEAAGPLLVERFLRPGRSLRWDALVERATGAPLTADHLVARLV